jgi:hypothetical protein
MPEGKKTAPPEIAKGRPEVRESGFRVLFAKLRKRRIIETSAAFIGALLATVARRWFDGTEKRHGNIKVEALPVPLIILATLAIDLLSRAENSWLQISLLPG